MSPSSVRRAWHRLSAVAKRRTVHLVQSVTYPRLRELLDAGAQLVEVLPEAEYAEEHLPGAINIPLKTLDAATAAPLDKTRAVIVYCWDGL